MPYYKHTNKKKENKEFVAEIPIKLSIITDYFNFIIYLKKYNIKYIFINLNIHSLFSHFYSNMCFGPPGNMQCSFWSIVVNYSFNILVSSFQVKIIKLLTETKEGVHAKV